MSDAMTPPQDDQARLIESLMLSVIQHGRDRCGFGFGKYPLGVLDAVQTLRPLWKDCPTVQAAYDKFVERLTL